MKLHPKFKEVLVGRDGTIYNAVSGKPYNVIVKREGYATVSFPVGEKGNRTTEKAYVHRLVAQTYIPNPDNKPQVNHKDLNKLNNNVDNLEWMTAKENQLHSWGEGSLNVDGEGNPSSYMTESLVREICELLQSGHRNVDISRKLGVKTYVVSDIRGKKTWGHISKEYSIEINRKKRRSPNTVLKIAELLEQKMTPKRIYKETGVSVGEINDIKHRVLFESLTKDYKF